MSVRFRSVDRPIGLESGGSHTERAHSPPLNAKASGSHQNTRLFYRHHPLDGIDRSFDQLIGLKFYAVGGLRLDPVPECLELRAEDDFLLEPVRAVVLLPVNLPLDLVGRQ